MDTASAPPRAVTAPRSGSLAPQPQPERGEFSVTFRSEGEFTSITAAERWLSARGFSVGAMERQNPIAFILGDETVPKWSRLSPEAHADLHGKLISTDFRKGPVTALINRDAPSSVLEAFCLTEEDLIDLAAQADVEARS